MPIQPLFRLLARSSGALVLVLGPVGTGAVWAAQTADPTATVAAAADRYAGMRGLCASFDQILVAGVLGRETRSAGTLCQERPDRFAMEFSDPAGDRIVVDGTHAWVWYRSINPETVLRLPVERDRGGFDFYREFLANPLEKYEISGGGREEVGGVSTVRVELVPRAELGYVGAVVWIDPTTSLVRRISIEERNGNTRTLTLADIRIDPAISPGTFTFDVPAGVQVTGPGGLE
jgi:outer membrane lipoprotein carrier protein